MTIKGIMQEGNALHTGEVVGSIPTAPTIVLTCQHAPVR
jgi:hypothetical protein